MDTLAYGMPSGYDDIIILPLTKEGYLTGNKYTVS